MPSRTIQSRRRALQLLGTFFALLSPVIVQAQDTDGGTDLRTSIAEALVIPTEQRFVGYRWETEPEIVALYFGADWCGPCHAFVPELKRIRAALKEAGADTEVVYVSLDESEREMRRYMRSQQMPWPAVDYRRLSSIPMLRRLGGVAPPNLVLLDRQSNVIASGWHGRRYTGLAPVLQAWMARLQPPVSTTNSHHNSAPLP